MISNLDRFAREAAKNKLIFALDVGSLEEAGELVRTLRSHVGMFKVGKQLFVKTGPKIIDYLHQQGGEVFLDLKFHDIPQTVARVSVEATRLGVAMFNLHASGSLEMMRRAVAEVDRVCRTERLRRPKMLAVTVLTSLSSSDLRTIGISVPVQDQVLRLALLAERAGMDGVVASPMEVESIRRSCGEQFVIVTPGIRRRTDARGDQARVMTPADAVSGGSDFVVVGRPIREASDPTAEADAIVDEMAAALIKESRRSR